MVHLPTYLPPPVLEGFVYYKQRMAHYMILIISPSPLKSLHSGAINRGARHRQIKAVAEALCFLHTHTACSWHLDNSTV